MNNNNDSGDNVLAIGVLVTIVLAGLMFSGYWELISKYVKDGAGIWISFFILFGCYKSIKSTTNNYPELLDFKNTSNMIFLYTFFGFFVIFGSLFVMAFERVPYITETTLQYVIALCFGFFMIGIINTFSSNLKSKVNDSIGFKLFKAESFTKILPLKEQAFDLPEYKAFELNDDRKVVDPKGSKVFTIFREDIFIEKIPIWEKHITFEGDDEIITKRVNPIFFDDFVNGYTRIEFNKISYNNLINKEPKNVKSFVFKLLVNKLYKNYTLVGGKNLIPLEMIFKNFDNTIEFIILELIDINKKLLNNFALGQLFRYAKKYPNIRQLLGAIEGVGSEQVKACGILYFMHYYMYKKENNITFDAMIKVSILELLEKQKLIDSTKERVLTLKDFDSFDNIAAKELQKELIE